MEAINKNLIYCDLYLMYDLSSIPIYDLPEGFHYSFYQKGDERDWSRIETSAKEFEKEEDAYKRFFQTFNDHLNDLSNRCFFIEDENNKKVATATAYCTENHLGKVHWVAIEKECQGKKLSKPLISKTLQQLKELGYCQAILHTQTYTWLATKIYLDMGFQPIYIQEKYLGWQIIKKLTNHPSLKDIEDIDEKLIYKNVKKI